MTLALMPFFMPRQLASGNDADTIMLLHADNTADDDSVGGGYSPSLVSMGFESSIKKFGSHSFYHTGSGVQYVALNMGAGAAFGTADYTIDFHYYPLGFSFTRCLVDFSNSAGTPGNAPILYVNSSGNVLYRAGNALTLTSGSILNLNTWNHIAVTRTSGTTRLFLDGVVEDSDADAIDNTSPNGSGPVVGIRIGGSQLAYGYTDEVRLSTVSRWSAAFTPPTQPYG
jgi:hypothetical protein